MPPREHADVLRHDAAYALRLMRRQAPVSAVAVLSLGLGIGASTAIFSVVNAVLLTPLPFPDPDRLVRIWETNPRSDDFSTSEPNYLDFRDRNRSFELMAAWWGGQFNLTGGAGTGWTACSSRRWSFPPRDTECITESLARALWPGGRAYPQAQWPGPTFLVRTEGRPAALALAQPRFGAQLLAGFAALAVLLAAVGVYGILSFGVAQRTQEIGVRIALGARAGDVGAMVARHGLGGVAGGIAVGLAGSLALGRVLSTLLFGIRPHDPATFAAVTVVLLGVAVAASVAPARRAARVDPVQALRVE
jgi:hypothetical protein